MSVAVAVALSLLLPDQSVRPVSGQGTAIPDASSASGADTSASLSPAAPGVAGPMQAQDAQTAPTAADEIVVRARPGGDPLRKVNTQAFAATQAVDDALTGPAALAYKRVVPDPVRSGLRNFFNNLHEPNVALNFLLQMKPGKAAETFGRFALNTTVGIGGVLDVAKRRPFRLPRRLNGFGDTLGYYGVGPGPFFFLPLIGPTTVRDFIGGGVDRIVSVSYIHGPFGGRTYALSTGLVRVLDRRAESDDRVRAVRASADPYETRRALFLHKRQAEIDHLRGRDAPTAGAAGVLPAAALDPTPPTSSATAPAASVPPETYR